MIDDMPPVFELLVGVHLLLLLAFIAVTSMLLLVTVVNRVRVRSVMLSWPNGRFFGLPIWSTLFLAVVLGFVGVSTLQGHSVYPLIFVGYLLGGMFWFAAAMIMSSIHVTPHGIILNVNRNGRALAWSQIVDYFEFGDEQEGGIVFFFADGSGSRHRLEVHVPGVYQKRFAQIVRVRLESRFRMEEEALVDPQRMSDG